MTTHSDSDVPGNGNQIFEFVYAEQGRRQFEELARRREMAEQAMAENRLDIIHLGQALLTREMMAYFSGRDALNQTSTKEIIGFIKRTLGEKMAMLEAFTLGLTAEQRQVVIDRLLQSETASWLADPKYADSRQAVAQAAEAQRVAEQAMQAAQARERAMRDLQAQSANETLRLREDTRTLQAQVIDLSGQVTELQTQNEALRSLPMLPSVSTPPAPALTEQPTPVSLPLAPKLNLASVPVPALIVPAPLPIAPGPITSAPTAAPPAPMPEEEGVKRLLLVMATRGTCERPRLAQILHAEYGVGKSPADFLINKIFRRAHGNGWIEPRAPDIQVAQETYLYSLTEPGRQTAHDLFNVAPVPSELARLVKLHDTLEHVVLILQARAALLEKYPGIVSVELYPAPVATADGQSVPDLTAQLKNGNVLLIECEREVGRKDEKERHKKWHKYYVATGGQFYLIAPDNRSMQTVLSEITLWRMAHGGSVILNMTNLAYLQSHPASEFWITRELKDRRA